MSLLSSIILVVLAVTGAASIVEYISQRLFSSRDNQLTVFVAPLKDGSENAEQLLRITAAKLNSGRFKQSYAVCLDCGMEDKTRKICEKICEDYGNIELMSKSEFARKFEICQNGS